MENLGSVLQDEKISTVAIVSLAILASLAFVLMGPMEFLLFVLGAVILTLILIKPFYGLSFLIFSIPYAGILQLAPKLTANKIFAVWVLVSFIIGILIRKESIDFISSKSLKFYMVFHIWLLLMFPFGTMNTDTIQAIFSRVFLFGLVFMLAAIPQTFQQFKIICLISAAGAAFLGIYVATFGMGAMAGEYGSRLSAGTNENVLSHALGVGLLLSFFALRNSEWRMKAFVLLLDLFVVYAILMTGSRGTWLALIFSIGLFPLFAPNIPFKKRLQYVSGGATALFVIIFGLVNNHFGHSGQLIVARLTEHDTLAQSSGGRVSYIWPVYFENFLQKPIFGWGAGFSEYIGLSAHNDFLWILAQTGLIGISLFILFHFYILKNILENKDMNLRLQSLILFVFLIIAGLTHNTVTLKSYSLAIGALCFLAKLTKKESEAFSDARIAAE